MSSNLVRTNLKPLAHFRTVLKVARTGLKPLGPLQSCLDGFATVEVTKCGFNAIGLASFVAVESRPATPINLCCTWVYACVLIKISRCAKLDVHKENAVVLLCIALHGGVLQQFAAIADEHCRQEFNP